MHSGSPISGGKSAVFSYFHKVKWTFPQNPKTPKPLDRKLIGSIKANDSPSFSGTEISEPNHVLI